MEGIARTSRPGRIRARQGQAEGVLRRGEKFARRAVAVDPTDAEAHFALARALGRVALSVGANDRVKYAKDVRTQALDALKYDSLHAGAHHVMGRWNAEIMRLSGFSRFFAKNFLGGDVFGTRAGPSGVLHGASGAARSRTHHPQFDFAEVYRDRDKPGDRDKANQEFQAVIDGPVTEYNDKFYKKQAKEELAKLH